MDKVKGKRTRRRRRRRRRRRKRKKKMRRRVSNMTKRRIMNCEGGK